MTPDIVGDDDELYRRVPSATPAAGQICYRVENGRVIFGSSAFNDRGGSPSVDRAFLRQLNPHRTRLNADDGVVLLTADAIRKLGPIQKVTKIDDEKIVSTSVVDVLPDPIYFRNFSHAVVKASPEISNSAFKRLKEGLARVATECGWHVEPKTPLPPRTFAASLREAVQYLVYRCR